MYLDLKMDSNGFYERKSWKWDFFGLKKELCKMKEFEMKVNESLSFDDI